MRQFEGGEPEDRCWAGRQSAVAPNFRVACDTQSGINHLGLCPKHHAEIVPAAQPDRPTTVVPSDHAC